MNKTALNRIKNTSADFTQVRLRCFLFHAIEKMNKATIAIKEKANTIQDLEID